MKPILLLLLLAATAFAAPPMDCNHHHQRHGHADDANKISPAQVVEAGHKKDDVKSVGDEAVKSAEVAKDSLQGVVGPEKKEEFKEVKEVKDKKLPALTKDKVEKKSTAEVAKEEGDKKKIDAPEKFLDLNIKNVVPKETSAAAPTKTKDDLQKATANEEESELADDATVAVAEQASDVLGTANKSLTAVGDALGKDSVSVDSVVVKNKNATAAITPDAAYAVAKKEVPAEGPQGAEEPKTREVTNMAKAPGGVKFEVPLTDSKKDRDLPIESIKDTKGVPEPPIASQNQMVISDTDAEQGDEPKKDPKKDPSLTKKNTDETFEVAPKAPIAKDTKDTSKTMMSDEAVAKKKDAKDTSNTMMMADEALKEAKFDADKINKDSKVKKSEVAPAPAGIQAPNDSKAKKSSSEPMMMSDEAFPKKEAKDTTKSAMMNAEALPKKDAKDTTKAIDEALPKKDTKDTTKAMMSDEAAKVSEAPKDAKFDADKTKTADLKSMEKKDVLLAAATPDKPEAIVKSKTRNISTRMMKKGLAGRNTPGFMTGSMFINV